MSQWQTMSDSQHPGPLLRDLATQLGDFIDREMTEIRQNRAELE